MIASWALRSLAAATIFMALVICRVFFTERIRLRMSRNDAIDRHSLGKSRRTLQAGRTGGQRPVARWGRFMPPASRLRSLLRRISFGLGCALVVLAAASVYVELRYQGRIRSVEEVPAAPVALVFGAGLATVTEPSPLLAERLDMAVALYRAGKVKWL